MGFHYVGWAGLERQTSGDPPTSASQSVGITGVSEPPHPVIFFLLSESLLSNWVDRQPYTRPDYCGCAVYYGNAEIGEMYFNERSGKG